jgi:hypothetical protein
MAGRERECGIGVLTAIYGGGATGGGESRRSDDARGVQRAGPMQGCVVTTCTAGGRPPRPQMEWCRRSVTDTGGHLSVFSKLMPHSLLLTGGPNVPLRDLVVAVGD